MALCASGAARCQGERSLRVVSAGWHAVSTGVFAWHASAQAYWDLAHGGPADHDAERSTDAVAIANRATPVSDISSAARDAIHSYLTGDATLTGMLPTYGGSSNVLSVARLPTDRVLPVVHSAGWVQLDSLPDGDDEFYLAVREIRVMAADDGDTKLVDDIADRVAALWRLPALYASFSIPGWHVAGVEADGPLIADPDDETFGRVVEVSIWASRSL